LHLRPNIFKTGGVPWLMKFSDGINGGWLTTPLECRRLPSADLSFAQDGVKNKGPGGFEKPVERLLTRGLETFSDFFTPDKAARSRRQTTRQKPRPSKPDGMKNYQEDDYFYRQT
jgi:hypothetical protein